MSRGGVCHAAPERHRRLYRCRVEPTVSTDSRVQDVPWRVDDTVQGLALVEVSSGIKLGDSETISA
jgi:hypothetical protein